MSDRTIVGYFIRRTYKNEPHPGKTLYAVSRRLYPTREEAEKVMAREPDELFDLDVCEAWMATEPAPSSTQREGE